MSPVDGPSLVQCSKNKEYVIIYYPRYDHEVRMRGVLLFVPVNNLINPTEARLHKPVEELLPCPDIGVLNLNVSCISTTITGPSLYFLGGLDPNATCSWTVMQERVVKDVYRYDLQNMPDKGSFTKFRDMIFGMYNPLLAQVGDNIYALGFGKSKDSDSREFVFQKYNFLKNKWVPLCKNLFDVNDCDGPVWVFRDNFDLIPHVVIGNKLHVSIGNSSFTYDPEKDTWYNCELFESFWSKKKMKKKNSGRPSQLNFYGKEIWNGAIEAAKERKMERCQFGGPPFGFVQRGIIWDRNVLLGIYHGDYPMIAFLLNNISGRVIKSQPLSLDNLLGMQGGILPYGAHLVDLGRDGHFGLVHFFGNEDLDEDEMTYRMELLTFKVEKIGAADDDNFLQCKVISNEVIIEKVADWKIASYCHAFCV